MHAFEKVMMRSLTKIFVRLNNFEFPSSFFKRDEWHNVMVCGYLYSFSFMCSLFYFQQLLLLYGGELEWPIHNHDWLVSQNHWLRTISAWYLVRFETNVGSKFQLIKLQQFVDMSLSEIIILVQLLFEWNLCILTSMHIIRSCILIVTSLQAWWSMFSGSVWRGPLF
jgi:hypothetical protein